MNNTTIHTICNNYINTKSSINKDRAMAVLSIVDTLLDIADENILEAEQLETNCRKQIEIWGFGPMCEAITQLMGVKPIMSAKITDDTPLDALDILAVVTGFDRAKVLFMIRE